jgi:hypothetical protein
MRYPILTAALLCAFACASRQAPLPSTAGAADQAPRRQDGIVFIENDLQGALARAHTEGKPLFVDAWAPW